MTKVINLLLFLALITFSVNAQELPLNPNCKHGVLDNGLTYYILENDNPKGKANFYIASAVGSAQETDEEHGLAHFAEHMAFNGTKNFPKNELREYLKQYGLVMGPNLNAYTAYYKTVYNINDVPTKHEGLIDSCLLVLHDWSSYVSFDQDELDAERGVITEEYRTRMADMSHTIELFKNNFPGSIYAKRTVIGDLDVIQNHTRDQIVSYYNNWYRPDLQAIVVVGDIDADQMEQKVLKLFGKIPARKGPDRVVFPIPENNKPLIFVRENSEYGGIKCEYLVKNYDTFSPNSSEGLLNDVCHSILFNILSDRYDELPKTYGDIIYDVNIQRVQDLKGITLVGLSSNVKNEKTAEAFELLVREMRRLYQYGVNQDELDKARDLHTMKMKRARATCENLPSESFAQSFIDHYFNGTPAADINLYFDENDKLIKDLTLDQINSYIKKHYSRSNELITITGPEVGLPSEKEVFGILNKDYTIEPYDSSYEKKELNIGDVQAGTIVKESKFKDGVTKWVLSNGTEVYLKNTDFDKDLIQLTGFSLGGQSLMDDPFMPSMHYATVAGNLGG